MNHFLLVLNSLLFGLGSWIAITGLWLEVPVLIHHLPEGWNLASYLTFSIQLANIVPLLYWFLSWKCPKHFNEVSGTNLQLFIGILASIVLIFYWEIKFYVFGEEHSVVLLVCAFLLSIVDCLSSVTFLPFMARFKSVYLTPYLIGEGLSGFLPMILASAQNVDESYDPKNSSLIFGPSVFFISLFITITISWTAFFNLQIHDFKKHRNSPLTNLQAFKKYILGYEIIQKEVELEKRVKLIKKTELDEDSGNRIETNVEIKTTMIEKNRKSNQYWNKGKLEYYYLQFLIFFACTMTFGLLPPLQPFSCLPISRLTLKYSVILSGLSYPIGCSIALFFKCKSTKILSILTILATLATGFIFYSALYSPNLPPLIPNDQFTLSVLMISCWIIFNLLLSYVKTMITTMLNDKNGQEALFYVGLFSQFGSVLGASTMFLLVNHFKIFKEK